MAGGVGWPERDGNMKMRVLKCEMVKKMKIEAVFIGYLEGILGIS